MKQFENTAARSRESTNACLDAERATTDSASATEAATARRVLDDLIERDRIRADGELLRFRDNADRRVAGKRFASPAHDSSVTIERGAADQNKKVEREVTDAFLDQERLRADEAVETQRREYEANRANLTARRHDTDDQLSSERDVADTTASALGAAQNELKEARGEQSHRNDEFSIVTHDLRSPLSVIVMNASRISESTREPATRKAAEGMTRAAARMERLLADLLDVARIAARSLHVIKRPHELGALVTDVLRSYQPLFDERGLQLSSDVPAGAICVWFDHDRIVQVLSNLLGNAMKFVPRGGAVRIQVTHGEGHVELSVNDDGPGIPPASLPHLFKRFWKVDSEERRGLGLGLYICAKIMEAHGGQIRAESEVGKGATFCCTLPLV
jgi:signal transduction histidine kinase